MLKLLLGTDWTANRDEILNMVAQDVHSRLGGRILMVPELISHDTERRLCQTAGDTSSRYAEVLSFTRLARRVADAAGCAAPECLDNGGRVVAMAAAARQLHSKLKAYASVETRPEFLTGLVDAVDEFKRCCISAADLRAAASRSEGAFAQKLEELSLILETYDSFTAQGKRDPRDQMTWLLEQMESMDFAAGHVFYIDGFPDFTRQHGAILQHLIAESKHVTVSLCCDEPGSKNLSFEKAGKTALELIGFARSAQVPYEIITVMPKPSPLHMMRQRLFQGAAACVPELSGHLYALRADGLYGECRAAAVRILDLIRSGCRYRDIGVVCSDMALYENALRLAFSRSNIPVYRSGTEDVLKKTVMNALLAAMDAALGGFERQDVMRYIKSVLSPLDAQTCDLVENYAIVWAVSGSRWTTVWENHPDGLGGEWDESSKARLAALNQARATVMDPLAELSQAFRNATDLSHQVDALCRFLEQICLADRLQQLAEYMDSVGDNRNAQILNQLWEILLTALEQLHDMLGQTAWDTDSFVRLFTLLLSQYDVGTIPTVLDAVMTGPVSAMRCHSVKHLIVLGAQEGSLPGYAGASGILTDREREQLRSLDVPLTGGGMEGLQSEFAEIYGVFSSASESVAVLCGSGQPSFVFSRLAAMAGGEQPCDDDPCKAITQPKDAAAYLAAFGAANAAEQLGVAKEYADISERADFCLGTVDKENVRALYGQKLNLSASQIDRQADCRFSYFLRYGLRAKELKEATVDPAEFGTYFHAVLERTAKKVMELGGFHQVSMEETVSLAQMYSAEYIAQRFSALDSSRLSYLFERNMQELTFLVQELWLELSASKFRPDQFEVGFGDGKQMPAVQIPDGDIQAQILGFVDRVDKWDDGHNNYFRVVDYKSGEKSFDYCDVFNGMGLQMLLYMFALEQGGEAVLGKHPIPVGVQYFSARFLHMSTDHRLTDQEAAEERGKTLKRKGLVLSDGDVLEAMQPEGAPDRLKAERNKNGDIVGDVADRRQFQMLRKYVFGILRKLVNEIASGKVEPNPYTRGGSHNACAFCPYASVCHMATVPGRRNYQAMKPARFWEEVEKEVGGNG